MDAFCQLEDSFVMDEFIYSASFDNNKVTGFDKKYCMLVDGYYIIYTLHESFCRYVTYYAVKPDFANKKIQTIRILSAKIYDWFIFNKNNKLFYYSTQPEQITWIDHPDSAGYDVVYLSACKVDFHNHVLTQLKSKPVLLKPVNNIPLNDADWLKLIHSHLN